MRVLMCVFLYVTSHAKNITRYQDDGEDESMQRKVDVHPPNFEAVPFGHLPAEGVDDLDPEQKQPFDPLELDKLTPYEAQEAMEILKKGNKYKKSQDLKPAAFLEPRDIYLQEMSGPPRGNGTEIKWYNFADTLKTNATIPESVRGKVKIPSTPQRTHQPDNARAPNLNKYSFQQQKQDVHPKDLNWTTCDQFAVKAFFSAKDIIDKDWVPFYVWSIRPHHVSIVHRFKRPTVKEKMRVLLFAFLFVTSHAQNIRRYQDVDEDEAMQRKVDMHSRNYEAIPFGHLTLEGVQDPDSKQKPPLDPLELDMLTPYDAQEALKMLKKGRKYIQFVGLKPGAFPVPRDVHLQEMSGPPRGNRTETKWYNFPDTLRRNVMIPESVRNKVRTPARPQTRHRPGEPRAPYFDKYSFQLKQDVLPKELNWTTCDQFAVKAVFSPKDIIDKDWVPFYVWSIKPQPCSIVHRFKRPTVKAVNEYKEIYNRVMNKTIDWDQPKLLMEGMMEMLLIAADKRGLFETVRKLDIPESVKKGTKGIALMPRLRIRLKIEDPYLVMMYCDDYYATVMAISGTEPTKYQEMKAEADTINFVGKGRVVWRNYEDEALKAKLITDRKIEEEEEKTIHIDVPSPPIGEEY